MKILLINHFPLAGSGSGTYTKNLAVSLVTRGHEVAVVLPENAEDFERVLGIEFFPVYFTPEDGREAPAGALPFNFPCFTTHPRSTFSFGDMDPVELGEYIEAFRSAIKRAVSCFRPDVIHGQHVWILSSLAAGLGIPLVLTVHGTDLMGYERWPELGSFARAAIDASEAVIAISRDNVDLVRRHFPEARDKIVFMRNGYDPGVFFPEEAGRQGVLSPYGLPEEDYMGKKIVIFAGKLTYAKGVDILLRAVSSYEKKRPDILTLIVGDGEEMQMLRGLAEELGLRGVRFLGNVGQNALRRLYNISDVDVVPSRREAFGLVAIEAMACGLPVVAADRGGLSDFVSGSVGALVKPEDPEAFADAVLRTLDRAEAAGQGWSSDIHGFARGSYAQDKIIHELEDLYGRCLG
ncbi:MAG: glycosyltransferase [Firmicutes bacterium]|nr:glycosyltransferase [Bacillota bacterium]